MGKGDVPGWTLISVTSLDILPTHIDGWSPASNKAVTLDMHGRPCYSVQLVFWISHHPFGLAGLK